MHIKIHATVLNTIWTLCCYSAKYKTI